MSNQYFSNLPDLVYPSLNPSKNSLFDTDIVKNLFVRPKVREKLFQKSIYFTNYSVKGNDRPDNVAYEVYNNSDLDWAILLANNIIDPVNEWPMEDFRYYEYLDEKYNTTNYNDTYYYETTEVRDSNKRLVLKKGLRVPQTFTIPDPSDTTRTLNPVKSVSYLDYENQLNDDKRNIVLIKKEYINDVINQLENIRYTFNSQYISPKLKSAISIENLTTRTRNSAV